MKKNEKKSKPMNVETLFPREEIMRQPSAFGVNHYVLAGAMVDKNEEVYSRSQVLAAIDEFKKRKVRQQ